MTVTYQLQGFGKTDYSGFERELWPPRIDSNYRTETAALKNCRTPNALATEEFTMGSRHSALLELHYADIFWISVIDPMHNLFLGTAMLFFRNAS